MLELGASSKFRTKNQIMEETSEFIFKGKLPKEWIVRKLIPDYGIDYEIEICKKFFNDNNKYELTGNIIWVQLKATESINMINEEAKFILETGLINYASKTTIPVILVVVDVVSEKIYWVNLRQFIKEKLTNEKYKIILNKTGSSISNLKEFDISSIDEWIKLSEENHIIQEMLLGRYLIKKAEDLINEIKTKKYNELELVEILDKLKSYITPNNFPILAFESHKVLNSDIIKELIEIDGSDFNLDYIDFIADDINKKLNILNNDIDKWIEKTYLL